MTEKNFLENTFLDVMEFFEFARNARRDPVKIALSEGVEIYKRRLSKECFSESSHPQVKAFFAYALEALTLINGHMVGGKTSDLNIKDVFERMRSICRDFK